MRLRVTGWMGRLLVVLGVAVAALGGPATAARAHAQLIETTPAHGSVVDQAPAAIELRFSEPVIAVPAATTLRSGETEVPGVISLEGSTLKFASETVIPDGTAVLDWRVTSQDGHLISGKLVFHVREITDTPAEEVAGTTWSVQAAVANAVAYLGLLLGGGLALFTTFIHGGGPEARDLRRLARTLLAAGATGALAAAVLKSVEAGGRFDFATVPPGTFPMVAVLAPGVVLAGWSRQRPAVAVGVAAALGSLAFVGHTRTFDPGWLVIGSDLVHLVAGAFWSGGLVGLALVVRRRREGGSTSGAVVRHFSVVAGWCLLAVFVSGLLMAWRIHGTWANLIGTGHGRLILVKLAIVAVVGGVAAFNHYRVLPSMTSALATARLSNTTVMEATGLALLLVVTGFLVEQDPAGQEGSRAMAVAGSVQSAIGDHFLRLDLEPGGPGVNTANLTIEAPDGSLADLASPPRIGVVDGSGNRTTHDTDPVDGAFQTTIQLPDAAPWTIEVRARVDAFTEAVQTLQFENGQLVPASGLMVTGAVMPEPPGGTTSAVVYMTVVAASDGHIVGAGSPACRRASIHESVINADGTATMEPRPHVQLTGGQPVTLSSGGLHVMCEEPSQDLRIGASVPFTLETAEGDDFHFDVDVVPLADVLE